eukprot:jgi/Ulvmu1/144/UM001_0148.1
MLLSMLPGLVLGQSQTLNQMHMVLCCHLPAVLARCNTLGWHTSVSGSSSSLKWCLRMVSHRTGSMSCLAALQYAAGHAAWWGAGGMQEECGDTAHHADPHPASRI